ncbi:hypothetical protein J2S00_003328 [Caldalkalibacillus uzonensis]|uniref:Uncharacterized protein n=1 Tax=Caldalkalibacillus uzonensis TaxID=353224 RepID=A0ABU0CVR3_9BACI|nr:hypothetical protein [Caldalkalibacillus uzonensis]MDQ0340513.1 hypothetical protein [Caldalkalibacillus uzonensis]
MDARIKALIDFTQSKFGLDNYRLHTHKLYRRVHLFNDTVYTLSMEWFPAHVEGRNNDGSNPDGTAVIDVDVHTRQFERVIFVGGKSYSKGIRFGHFNTDDIIKWIEDETGLRYGKQFHQVKKEERELHFQACIDGVAVSPSGSIDMKVDEEGRLILFTVNGHFPAKERVKEETFSLTLTDVEPLAKAQLKLVHFPSNKQKRIIPVYGVEEIYITNDQTATIPFEPVADVRRHVKIDKTLHWQTPINRPFERTEISLSEDVKPEQAFVLEPHPDTFPITKTEQEQCKQAVEHFMRQVFPKETGEWVLTTLHRDRGYILATLKRSKQDNRLFQSKLFVFLDPTNFQAVNYMDNKTLLEVFQHFEQPQSVTLNKNAAYEKIRAMITLTPVYVFDFEQNQYILCGKVDCQYGVHAVNGEVVVFLRAV